MAPFTDLYKTVQAAHILESLEQSIHVGSFIALHQNHFLGADLLFSITYAERIKIENFCEVGLSNIQPVVRLNRSPATISMSTLSG